MKIKLIIVTSAIVFAFAQSMVHAGTVIGGIISRVETGDGWFNILLKDDGATGVTQCTDYSVWYKCSKNDFNDQASYSAVLSTVLTAYSLGNGVMLYNSAASCAQKFTVATTK